MIRLIMAGLLVIGTDIAVVPAGELQRKLSIFII